MDNWQRNKYISVAAKRILENSRPPASVGGRRAQHNYIQQMRRQLSDETGCSIDTAARHIGAAVWRRTHGLRGKYN